MAELRCWNCGASLAALPRPITRHMNCPECFEDLHCCRLCRHYLADGVSSCDHERAEPPVHKEGANFCDYFRPNPDAYEPTSESRHARAKANLDALFGNDQGEPNEGEDKAVDPIEQDPARRRLDDLFR